MCKAFYYKKYDFDTDTNTLTLSYAVQEGKTCLHTFHEQIIFPPLPTQLSHERKEALKSIFFLTHIAFGISYYKAFCPEEIKIESGKLTAEQATFFNRFFVAGLGEFAVRNHLNLQGKITFPYEKDLQTVSFPINFQKRFLVPIGGGKDSCVSLDVLKKIGVECCGISVGNPRPIQECAEKSQLPHLVLKRVIDSHLIELNQTGAVLNGHVPITGMLAFLLWACGLMYDYQYVALSCERSANSGNLMQGSLSVNHQYSKSFEFETDFYKLTQTVTPNFRYFSLLRPLSEMHIARLFAQNCRDYFPVFTSCNKAFKLDESKRLDRWCGACDKCRFVFLILAPFMERETLINLIGCNPLNDSTQLLGYEELLGFKNHKPFECVGEIAESRVALALLSAKQEWQEDIVIRRLAPILQNFKVKESYQKLLTPSETHLIPQEILSDVMAQFKC